MKKSVEFLLFISLILCCLFCLTSCETKSDTISFKGIELEISRLSENSIKWIETYNAETEEVQKNVTYIPPEIKTLLIELGYLDIIEGSNEQVLFEKPISLVTKILSIQKGIEDEKSRFLISSDKLYWCEYDEIEKLKEGYIVEIIYSGGIKKEDTIILVPDSVTIISATYNYIGLYLDVIDTLWHEKEELNKDISLVLIDFTYASFLTETDRNALLYLLKEKYDIDFIEGTEDSKEESDLLIRIYLGSNSDSDYLFDLAAIKKKNDVEYVKLSDYVVKSIDNQLFWEKK